MFDVLEQIEQLKKTLDTLNYKHWFYETAKKGGTCSYPLNMAESEIPKDILEIKKECPNKFLKTA